MSDPLRDPPRSHFFRYKWGMLDLREISAVWIYTSNAYIYLKNGEHFNASEDVARQIMDAWELYAL